MRIGQLLIEAVESLSNNKVRSSLTMLGIVIGVAAVIAMMAIGNGTTASVTSQIEKIGANLLYVSPGGDAVTTKPLTTDDAAAILAAAGDQVARVAPIVQGNLDVSIAGASTSAQVLGVTPDYFQVQSVTLAEGSLLTQEQVDKFASVVLLGSEVADDLFGTTGGLVGKTVRMQGQIFKVAGVLEAEGGTGFGSSDTRILTPLSTAQLRLLRQENADEVDQIYVQAASAETVEAATEKVTLTLRARHRTYGDDDFRILSTASMLETASAITGTLTLFLGGVAGISLLVGGIGIMNIMLVTVTERTREIGLRKAIGARNSDIRVQFLIESSLLSLGGGLLGVATGWAIAQVVGQVAASSGTSIDPVVTLSSVLMATLFSGSVGLFFGIYPANRAAGLEPVEALRTD